MPHSAVHITLVKDSLPLCLQLLKPHRFTS